MRQQVLVHREVLDLSLPFIRPGLGSELAEVTGGEPTF